ncbi:GNAT family protein [Aurantimonas sp. A2-1-M11]|uniref:GNAT family N-acetyltransferase n=1 Tax=Aurantimonas sp. A2-1-M11 TaxID=3113712 RepID=UPI002F93FE24
MSDLSGYQVRSPPGTMPLVGRSVTVAPIVDERHFADLFAAYGQPENESLYDYLPYGPFAEQAAFGEWASRVYLAGDMLFHALVPATSGRAEGVAALMRMDRPNGVIEIGHICLAPSLKRTVAATEAFFLMMGRVFDELGYRRFEWKCDDGNGPSKRAAERLGFTFEGLFRQHMIVKGRNRDTAWFAMLDSEWPALDASFRAWLAPDNFDPDGRQRRSLGELRRDLARSR